VSPDLPKMIARLERLVGFNTENPPGQEIEAAQFLMQELKVLGLMRT